MKDTYINLANVPSWLSTSSVKILCECYYEPQRLINLSQASGVSSAAVTGLMDRLEAHELITRSNSPSDRRVLFASLTEKGRALVDEFMIEFDFIEFHDEEPKEGDSEHEEFVSQPEATA